MYKLIAIDLDETLFSDDKSVCDKNINAIQKAVNNGLKIAICTGRSPGMIPGLFKRLNIEVDDQYSIYANGAYICNNTRNKVLHQDILSKELATKIYEYGRKLNLGIQIFCPKCTYFIFNDEKENELSKILGETYIHDDNNFYYVLEEPVLKYIFVERDHKKRIEYMKQIQKDFPECSVSLSSNRYIEINKKGIDKGYGLKKLCDALNIDIKDSIGIGDNLNDYDLITSAGLGVSMINGIDEIKNISDVITTLDNNQGGVGEIIEKYMLGE